MTIKSLVIATNLSQRAFAEKFHIPLRTLENWISGVRNPPPYVCYMIQEILRYENQQK